MDNNELFREDVRAANNIRDVIHEDGYELRCGGEYCRGKKHDSLVVNTKKQMYYWNSMGEYGDVFTWVMKRRNVDFVEALRILANRAGLKMPEKAVDKKRMAAYRAKEDALTVAVRVMHRLLLADPEALDYLHRRGMTDKTIKEAQLGFTGRRKDDGGASYKEIRGEFSMHDVDPESPAAVAILGYKGDVARWARAHNINVDDVPTYWVEGGYIPGLLGRKRIVFPHMRYGRVHYISARNFLGDEVYKDGRTVKAYNLPVALVGKRQMYFGTAYHRGVDEVVIVEGQMDALTLSQWGIPAVALAGTSWRDHAELLTTLRDKHKYIYLGLDADKAGAKALSGGDGKWAVMDLLGPTARVVVWPDKGDANDWLQAMMQTQKGDDEQKATVRDLLAAAEPIILHVCRWASGTRGPAQDDAMRRAFEGIAQMDSFAMARYRQDMADALGIRLRQFNAMLKTAQTAAVGVAGDKPGDKETIEFLRPLWVPVDGEGEEKSGWFLEYVYDRENDAARVAYRDPAGRIGVADYVDVGTHRYMPVEPDAIIRHGAVVFPSDIGPVKNERELVAIVEMFLRRYFLLDNPLHYRLAAYYVLLTWLYDRFPAIPYLRARGKTDTGKSEFMLRLGAVCYRLIITTGISTTASYKDAIDRYSGTMFMDEMDIADKFDDRVVLLNVGAMKKQALVWKMVEVVRADGTRTHQSEVANVYGPKLITMYGTFGDDATESRCITLELMPHMPIELKRKGIPMELPPAFYAEAAKIRNMLLTWRLRRWQPDEFEMGDELTDYNVSTRLNQVTRPLKYIAQGDADMMRDVGLFIRAFNDRLIVERTLTREARVLDAVVSILYGKHKDLCNEGALKDFGDVKYALAQDIAKVANEIMDAMNEQDEDGGGEGEGGKHKRRKSMTTRSVTKICRTDLQLKVHRLNNGMIVVLDEEKIEVMMYRYGIKDYENQEKS